MGVCNFICLHRNTKKGDYMKKTRKVLSFVLSVLVAIGSLPLVYTGTAAAGTIDDPTKAMEESNPFEQEDLFKLNIEHSNNDFFFYQTVDDEYFVVKQSLSLQQYKVSLGSNRSLTVHGVKFYEGGSNIADSVDNAGVVEEPTITDNKTAEFKSNYYVSDSWVSTHENSSGLDCTGDVSLHASGYDLNGRHKNYTWDHNVIFKGNPAGVTGQINTGYYERITWDWVSDDSAASMDFRIQTTITVVDAREFVKAVAKANDALANPGDHSEGYISAIQATVSAIPEDAKNLTGKYDQATLDGYANNINKIQEDAGNYTEYNFIYSLFSSMTNDNGTYSGESFAAFKAAIAQINADLPKDLSGKDQQIINDAVAALRNAYETILVNNATLTPGVTHTETIVDMTVSVGIEFNLIQVKDNQKFSLAQPWTISHNKSSSRKFAVTLKTDDADTNAFISRLDPSSYGTQDFDNKALSQNGATVFTCWDELDANGAFKDSSDFLNDDRTINADYDGFKKGNTYYLQSTPIFYGMTPEQTGATQYFYTQNFYVGWSGTFGIGGDSGSSAFKTTINITDARPLVDAYEQAGIIIADKNEEDCPYTAEYIAQLETAYNSVPRDMVRGLVYYNQDTVNTETEKLTSLLNNPQYKADYTEYDKAVAEAESIIAANNPESVYEPSAFQSYVTGVGEVPVPERNLSSAEQGTIDASTNALIALKNTLEANRYADYTELNAAKDAAQAILDNPTAYAPETVEAVRNALNEANEIPDGMVVGVDNVNQKAINDAADALNSVINSAVVLDGDYTAYNQAKAEIDAIINGGNADENGNPIYSEEIFTNVTNYVANIDANLDKNLKADSQTTIDDATAAMSFAKTYLERYKYADYTAFEEAKAEIEKIVNSTDGTYTEETIQAAKDALDSANAVSPGMVVGKDNANQDIIDAATDTMNQVIANAKEKADYSGLDEAIKNAQDIVDAPEGTYTDKTVEEAQKALDAAEALDKDLEKNDENQAAIDKVIEDLTNAANNAKEKADYTGLDEAIKNAQDIVDAPEGTYTEESVKAAQDALDAAEALDKDLEKNDENQAAIDKVIEDLTNAANNAEEKADYTEFDKVVEDLENIVENPDNYTAETVDKAQEALDSVKDIDRDMPATEQDALDEITNGLKDVVDNAKEKADYTDYNDAKDAADKLVNDDGNGNPIYDEDAFNEYKEAVEKIDSELSKDLPESEQSVVDEAAQALKDLRTELDSAKGTEDSVIDPETTVDEIINDVVNNSGYSADEIIFEFRDYLGNELAGEDFVGTGSTMKAILKSTGELLEYKLFIVMGDVNGDGEITNEDYEISTSVNLGDSTHDEAYSFFFTANDMDADGVIDVLDTFEIVRKMK